MADTRMTLLDVARSTDPDGKQAQVIEILNQTNIALQDAPAYASNAPTSHRVTLRSSLPTVSFTKINQGVIRSKSTTEQRQDSIGLVAGLSEVDSKMRKIIGDAAFAAKRKSEDSGFIEAMSQFIGGQLFYGDTKANEASFDGLSPRMMASYTTVPSLASQVWSMGSVTGSDGTSIYIVDWGERAVHLIYPPNSVAGIDSRDLGEMRVTDADGNPMMAFVSAYDWSVGLAVEDPRHLGRLANIDLSDSLIASPTQGQLTDKLIDVMGNMPDPGGNQRVMYCHPRLFAAFHRQALSKTNLALTIEDYLGKPTPHFWGYPIRRHDQISITESTVS